MAWYDEADDPAIRAMMNDRDRLPLTWGEWHQRARKGEQDLIAKGLRVIRVVIQPQPFAAWCALRGLDIDAQARTRFAAEEAARQLHIH